MMLCRGGPSFLCLGASVSCLHTIPTALGPPFIRQATHVHASCPRLLRRNCTSTVCLPKPLPVAARPTYSDVVHSGKGVGKRGEKPCPTPLRPTASLAQQREYAARRTRIRRLLLLLLDVEVDPRSIIVSGPYTRVRVGLLSFSLDAATGMLRAEARCLTCRKKRRHGPIQTSEDVLRALVSPCTKCPGRQAIA